MKFLFAGSLLFIKIAFFPSVTLLLWMGLAIVFDFISGLAKAIILKQARTSSGYRKTVVKFMQYGGSLFVGIALAHTAQGTESDQMKILLSWFNDGLVIFITYIEVTSIFENLYACDNTSPISKYFISPALKILTFQIKNNPLINGADQLPEQKQP